MKSCESDATGGVTEPVEHFFIGDRPEDGGLIDSSPEFVPPADVPADRVHSSERSVPLDVDTADVPLDEAEVPADEQSSAGIPAFPSEVLDLLAEYQGGSRAPSRL